MLDDVIAGQAVNPQQVQRQVVAETPIAAAPANVSTPVNAVAQGNSQELQRRIEQVQRTANTIQSRLGQLNDQMEQLNQQQQRTTQVVRELEKSWLEQILATNEPEQPTAEDSPGIAPDAYRYVAPTNQFSFP
jgi:methyl-accepting chemotaxis protein